MSGESISHAGQIYFVPGEAIVVLERTGDAGDLPEQELDAALREHFAAQGYALATEGDARATEVGGRGARQQRRPSTIQFPVPDGQTAPPIFRRVTFTPSENLDERDDDPRLDALLRVARACDYFNRGEGDPEIAMRRRSVGAYRLTLSPNWLALPFGSF